MLYFCAMMYNTKETIKDLEGIEFLDYGDKKMTYGTLIARILARAKHEQPEKCIKIAMNLMSNDMVELDKDDKEIILSVCKSDQFMNNILQFRISEYLA